MIKNDSQAPSCTCPSGDGSLVHPCPAHPAEQAEAERSALWAVHAQGPDELYAAFSRENAEKHAAELNALPMPEGIAVGAVVVPSPWPAVQHWQYLAEQEQDHKNEIAGRLRQFERICEGLPQDAIDGGWTVQGIRGYAKRLEDQLKAAQAEVEALRAELQSQRERNTELIFKLGSATNGWGRCEKERDAALARIEELDKQCRDDVARALGLRPKQERGFAWSYLLASIKSCVKASEDSAQAQHSVPKGFREKFEQCMELAFAEITQYVSPEKARDPQSRARRASALATELRAMLSAAPGNSAQHSVPEGWKLVPVEPTPEMLDARRDCEDGMDGYLVEDTEYYFPDRGAVRAFLARVYQGLIAAAPAPGGER
ncbi:hypothetical protein [Pseudomonas aeruginosa]|uniref:hypothetical protein n=1 Tax=Pseudomonas aeruginosa TaxID=287 RepID=UPI0030047CAC